MHEFNYNSTARRIPFFKYSDDAIESVHDHVQYSFLIYATSDFEALYKTSTPLVATCGAALAFVLVILAVLGYETYVRQRDTKVQTVAQVTDGIVSSLFPCSVREQVLNQNTFSRESNAECDQNSKRSALQIARYFPETTVLYADIAGFTSWSSRRPPEQVFILLETIYGSLTE
jgi:hypothetical protein